MDQNFAACAALEPFRICVARRRRVDDEPAADGGSRAEDDAVAASSNDRCVEPELGESADPHDAREHGRSAVVDEHARRDRCELLDLDVEPVADVVGTGLDEGVTPAELSPFQPGKRNCDALPGCRRVDLAIVDLDAANAYFAPHRVDAEHVSSSDPSRPESSRRDGPDAVQAEHTIDVEPRRRFGPLAFDGGAGQSGP